MSPSPAASSTPDVNQLTSAERQGPLFPSLIRVVAYAYLVSVPFEINLVVAGRSLSFWLALALAGLVFLHLLASPSQQAVSLNMGTVLPVAAVVVFAWASYLWSISPGDTLGAAVVLSMSAITWFSLALALTGALAQGIRALCVGTTLMSIVILTAEVDSAGRADTAGDSNDAAVLLGVAAAVLVSQITRRGIPLRRRLLYAALLLLHVVALLATGSRTGVLAILAAVVVLVGYGLFRVRVGLLVGLIILGALVAGGFVLLDLEVPERILEINAALETGELSNRERYWDAAQTAIPSVLGIGFGAAPTFILAEVGRYQVVHSVYLGVALELGLVGALLWAWMFGRLLSGIRGTAMARELALASVVIMVMASTLTLETRRPLWVVLTFLAAASLATRREKSTGGGAA